MGHESGDDMSKYSFVYTNDVPSGVSVNLSVEFDDARDPFIENMLVAFEQFLLGVTFQPGTIHKYLDMDAVQDALYRRAQLVRDL